MPIDQEYKRIGKNGDTGQEGKKQREVGKGKEKEVRGFGEIRR